MNEKSPQAWFKQGWPWFLIAVPLITVIAGITTYQIASDNPHSMVKDDYFKEGLAINQSLAREEKAGNMKLIADIKIESDAELISVYLNQPIAESDWLMLSFSHPTQPNLDLNVTLEKLSDNNFVAQLPTLPQAYWHIRLSDSAESWLLKSRWHYPRDKDLQLTYR